jgi:sarcosine oxidase subunit alpha
MSDVIHVLINGQSALVKPGTSVAAAVLNAGTSAFRKSIGHVPRGPVCGMGVCFECRVSIDGVEHLRSCMLACAEGMVIETDV